MSNADSKRHHRAAPVTSAAYARYIGRIGALAVALGVGMAVATTPGVAWATPDTENNSSDSAGTAANSPEAAAIDTPSPGSVSTRPSSTVPTPRSTKGSKPTTSLPGTTAVSQSPSETTQTSSVAVDVVVRSSGGALTSGQDSLTTEKAGSSTIAPTTASALPTTAKIERTRPVSAPTPTGPRAQSSAPNLTAESVEAHNLSSPTPAAITPRTPKIDIAVVAASVDSQPGDVTAPQMFAVDSDQPVSSSVAEQMTAFAAVNAPAPLPAPADPIAALLNATANVATAAMAHFLTPAPGAPADSPLLWAVLGWARRQFFNETPAITYTTVAPDALSNIKITLDQTDVITRGQDTSTMAPPQTLGEVLVSIETEFLRTFFNQTPTLAYDPRENSVLADGRIVGNLHPNDADDAILTYTATDPLHGEVVAHPDGTFTYTPDAGYIGPDAFNVTVSDAIGNGFHIHGLPGLIHLLTFGLVGTSGDTSTQAVNVGFDRTVLVSGLSQPTDFRFLPDGRILITEKGGAIKVYKNGQLQNTPLMVLPVTTSGESGIDGFAVDPQFQTNGYLYVAYTTAAKRERLSRFKVIGDTANLASELVLVESDQPANDFHHGGAVAFGPDGKLYWGVGDNFNPQNSQSPSTIHGKVLRLNPDGTVPSDNPFANTSGVLPQIYAFGFRNPYRFASAPGGNLLVADVGQLAFEEVNLLMPGANYGWPLHEGACNGCSYTNPIYAYPRGAGAAITSVLVYTGSAFGTSYQDEIFIADLVQGWIKVLTCNSDYTSCGGETMFDSQAGITVQLIQGPDDAIYQLTYTGELSRIAGFLGAPTAAIL